MGVTGLWEGYGAFGDWVLPNKASRHRQTGSPAVRPAVTSAGTTRTLVCRRLDECGTRPTGQRRVAARAHGGGQSRAQDDTSGYATFCVKRKAEETTGPLQEVRGNEMEKLGSGEEQQRRTNKHLSE